MSQCETSCNPPRSFDEYKQTVFERFSPLFFNAIAHWSRFQSDEITKNRIQLLEQFSLLLQFLRHSENREKRFTFHIDFERHRDTIDCQQTRQEQIGDLLINMFDYFSQSRLTESENKIIERLSEQATMSKIYNYMHDLLLQPLYVLWRSGLSTVNNESQPLLILFNTFQSLILTYSKVFLFSESAGLLSIHLKDLGLSANSRSSSSLPCAVLHRLKVAPLSAEGEKFFQFVRSLDRRSPVTTEDSSLPSKERRTEKQPSHVPFHKISAVSLRSLERGRGSSSEEDNDVVSVSSASCSYWPKPEKRRSSRKTGASRDSHSSDDKASALSRKRKTIESDGDEEFPNEDFWTTLHPAINTRVAKMDEAHAKKITARMAQRKGKKNRKNSDGVVESSDSAIEENTARLQRGIVIGEVVQYSPTSSQRQAKRRNHGSNEDRESSEEGEREGRYRVLWENDEISVLTQGEMENGSKFYNDYYGWKATGHESIGTSVAKYFYLPGVRGEKQTENHKKVFFGRVTKYAPPEEDQHEAEDAEGLHLGELFHVSWEDGDQEDLDYFEYQQGRALFQALKVDPAKRKPSLQRRKQMLGKNKTCCHSGDDVIVLSED